MTISEEIVKAALADHGQQEIKGNHGWKDPKFDALMRTTGWQDGQAWCSYWAEKVWRQVYSHRDPNTDNVIGRLFSANAVQTFDNFWNSVFPTSNDPIEGAVVIWKHMTNGSPSFVGDTQWIKGHAGIVIDTEGSANEFVTMEGNSNDSGGREGIEVARQVRRLDFETVSGLRLMGFIHPIEI